MVWNYEMNWMETVETQDGDCAIDQAHLKIRGEGLLMSRYKPNSSKSKSKDCWLTVFSIFEYC